jgi:hypothetical protein
MTGASFPFGVLGLVHLANRIERLRPVDAGERLNLRVWAADLAPHDRGRQFDVLAEAVAGGELVWREHSTYLHRERGGGGGGRNRSEPPVAGAIWTLPGDIGPATPPSRATETRPHAPADRPAARAAWSDRPWHVDRGPLPRGPGGHAAGGLRRRRALQAAAAHPRPRGVSYRNGTLAMEGAASGKPHLEGTVAAL